MRIKELEARIMSLEVMLSKAPVPNAKIALQAEGGIYVHAQNLKEAEECALRLYERQTKKFVLDFAYR